MTAKVHIWFPKYLNQKVKGHGSLELSDGSYVSWRWDCFEGDSKTDSVQYVTFQDDVNFEGRSPDQALVILPTDEAAIRDWWKEWQTENRWSIQGDITPCFTVLEAVMMGLGWARIHDGFLLDPADLIKQLNRLGMVQVVEKAKKKCAIL